jgi:hypothetical protein
MIFVSLRVVVCGLGNVMLVWVEVFLLIVCASLMPYAAGILYKNVVDIFNGMSGAWSTAALSVARYALAATSLQNLAIFAGGSTTQCTCCFIDVRFFGCFVARVGE